MTTTIPREELEIRFQRARQRIRNQRNELRALNKTVRSAQVQVRDTYRQVERFKQLWWEATHGTGFRYGWTPPPIYVPKVAWLPTLVALVLGLIIGHFT